MWHNTYFVIPAVLLAAASLYASRTRQRVGHVPHVQGLPGRGLPLMDAAFLSGGPGRVFDTALVRMHLSERAVISRAGLVTLTGHKPYDAVDQAVLDAVGPGGSRELAPLRRAVMRSAAVQEIGDRLADRGLMRRPERLRRARTARRLLWLALLGAVVSTVLAHVLDGAGSDRPALWIPVLLLLIGGLSLLVTRPAKGRITPAGERQLSLMKIGTPWTPSAGLSPKMTGGVLLGALALGGLAAAGLEDDELQSAMLAAAAQDEAMKSAAASSYASASTSSSSSSSTGGSSGSSCGGSASWCGSSHSGSSGCGGSSSSCGSSSSSCGSGSSSCGSSSSSCGSSSSSCGSSSSSCGGGGGCGS
ncbi:TIGR04222 domain-containing membrane protein [Kitasatospora sp. NPDC086801]|uniref:TIGR04222 domain-containing membrane protein n=1 Tax=Kitasatospora sp. NPDC086801 TaxID=3364066 RepID=UPI0038055BBF